MKGRGLVIGILAFCAVLGIAFVMDSIRVVSGAYSELVEQDDLMKGYEERYINTAASLDITSPPYMNALNSYRNANGMADRRAKFENLVLVCSRESIPKIDASNPIGRRLGDELAGSLNRRSLAEKRYTELEAVFKGLKGGVRGQLASLFKSFP